MSPSNFNLKLDVTGVKRLKERLSHLKNSSVKVGILAGKSQRNDNELTNVDIGAKHELGSFSENIPRRSFIEMPLIFKRKQLAQELSKKSITEPLLHGNMVKGLSLIGVVAENIIQGAFASGGYGKWQPLSPITVNKKGSSAILIETAQLRRSISSKVIQK